jgi:ribose transport system substrate-binding protein
MKKVILIILLALLLVACAKQPEPTQELAEPTLRDLQNGVPFRFVVPNNQHPIVRIMMLGFFEACEDYDVDCVMAGIDGVDTAAWITQAETTISLGSSGVVFYPDSTLYEVQRKIMKAGIPMVGIHVALNDDQTDLLDGWVAPNVEDFTTRLSKVMADEVDCKGPIAITLGSHNDIETPDVEFVTANLKALCPGIEVLEAEEEGFEPAAAIAKAAAILSAHPDITGAYSVTGAGSTTWATALRDAGYQPGDVVVISKDYSEQNLDFVRDGWVHCLVGQPLYEETYRAVELLVELLKGNEIQFRNDYPAPLIFAADVDKYYEYGTRVTERWGGK